MISLKLSSRELLFLDSLCILEHGHCTQDFLRSKLEAQGMDANEFKQVKRKLLLNGYIGIVYGNITLEKKNYIDKRLL